MVKTCLTKRQILELFPHLSKELNCKRNYREDGYNWAAVHNESSRLESAVLVEGKSKSFPHPCRTTYRGEDTTIDEVRVDFVGPRGGVQRTLKQATETTCDGGSRFKRGEDGENADELLAKINKKPRWVIVKYVRTETSTYGNGTVPLYGETIRHSYRIEAYKLRP